MVGGFSLLSSPIIDSPLLPSFTDPSFATSCPCICLDTLNLKNGGHFSLERKSKGKKQSKRSQIRSLELNSSFVGSGKDFLSVVIKMRSRKQRKIKSPVIVSELGGQYEDSFEDVKTQLLNYFTYKATRTVLTQLYEMNPPQYTWLYNFLTNNSPTDGKVFIRNLGKERQDLAERIMITRLHLYGKWIKKCDHAEIYKYISDENLELMRERLLETIVWPSDDNTEKIG